MSEVQGILSADDDDEKQGSVELIQQLYEQLKSLARTRMFYEKPGQTLTPTALVHEAYLRVAGTEPEGGWDGRGHFFGAAAKAMRRIIVENARRKRRIRHGGKMTRVAFGEDLLEIESPVEDVLAFNDVLELFEKVNPKCAALVNLVCFAGVSVEEAAELLEISVAQAYRRWKYARAWLYSRMLPGEVLPT